MFLTTINAATNHFNKTNEILELKKTKKEEHWPLFQIAHLNTLKYSLEPYVIPFDVNITLISDIFSNFRILGCNGNHTCTLHAGGEPATITNLSKLEIVLNAWQLWSFKITCICSQGSKCLAQLICDAIYLQIPERSSSTHWHFIFALDKYLQTNGVNHPVWQGPYKKFYDAFHSSKPFDNDLMLKSSVNNKNDSLEYDLMLNCACCSGNVDTITKIFTKLESSNFINDQILNAGLRHAFVCQSMPVVELLETFAKQKNIKLDWFSALVELFYKINVHSESKSTSTTSTKEQFYSNDIVLDDSCLEYEYREAIKHVGLIPDLENIVIQYAYKKTFFEQINAKLWRTNSNPITMNTIVSMIKQYAFSTKYEQAKWFCLVEWYLQHLKKIKFDICDSDRKFLTSLESEQSPI